jgi:hypothetical protein
LGKRLPAGKASNPNVYDLKFLRHVCKVPNG